jgi:hypothetical protein
MEKPYLTITTGHALAPAFQQAFSKLGSQNVPLKVAYWLGRIHTAFVAKLPDALKARDSILKPLEGKPLTDEARDLLNHLFNEPITLPLTEKLTLAADAELTLSAADVVALEPILEILCSEDTPPS